MHRKENGKRCLDLWRKKLLSPFASQFFVVHTSVKKKPIKLAQSIKRDDMVEYFKELYPQSEVDEDESSQED